jgi:hypothetical protein
VRLAPIAATAALALVAIGGATYLAGEQTEVAVLRTQDRDGAPHDTKLWVVDYEGVPWVRVANPRRLWFKRLSENAHASLIRGGVERAVVARPNDAPDVREAIDARFREKYGRTDWWYGVLLRRHPIPVRLDPVPAAPGP